MTRQANGLKRQQAVYNAFKDALGIEGKPTREEMAMIDDVIAKLQNGDIVLEIKPY